MGTEREDFIESELQPFVKKGILEETWTKSQDDAWHVIGTPESILLTLAEGMDPYGPEFMVNIIDDDGDAIIGEDFGAEGAIEEARRASSAKGCRAGGQD